jgi:hypothetical protein
MNVVVKVALNVIMDGNALDTTATNVKWGGI